MAEPDPLDPLGRIADQGSRPYPAPEANYLLLVRHWERHYATVTAGLDDDALTAGLVAIDQELVAIGRDPLHWWPRPPGAGPALDARAARLEGRRAAYVAEAARRAEAAREAD